MSSLTQIANQDSSTADTRMPDVPARSSSSSIPMGQLQRNQTQRSRKVSVDEDAVHGYPHLSVFMGNQTGAAIYRRFASLNARRLLYRQAEIVCLEHELSELEKDYNEQSGLDHVHHGIRELKNAPPDSIPANLWKKILEVDGVLENYNHALLEQKMLCDLPRPSNYDVKDLFNFVHNDGRWLQHPEDTIWEVHEYEQMQKDLVSLKLSGEQDRFSKAVNGPMLEYFHKNIYLRFKKRGRATVVNYPDKIIARIVLFMSAIFSAMLPACSIIGLYFIPSLIWRLVFIAVFSGVFMAAMLYFTVATRTEMFLASVGMAGVQAVFVSASFGSTGCGCA